MTTQTATITDLKTRLAPVPAQPVSVGLTDSESFALAQRVARMFSESMLVPKAFQGSIGNCVIALNMASRMGADPLMVMQNLYVVHGTPAWSAQFMIATFNACGRFSAIRYEFKGEEGKDDWSCRAWAMEKETGQRIEGAWVSIGLAKKEGWHGKNGSKWQAMPMQMLMYRSASWFIRAYAPEIAMGLRTADEIKDTYDMEEAGDGSFSVKVEDMKPMVNPEPAKPEHVTNVDAAGAASHRTRPTAAEMDAKRQAAKAELDQMGFFHAVQDAMSKSWQGWSSAECERALEKGRAMVADRKAKADAERGMQNMAPDVEATVDCPDSPKPVKISECNACNNRNGCPSWPQE